MKKILVFTAIALSLVLVSNTALAAKKSNSESTGATQYTTEQQACIKTAQAKRFASMKAATTTLNNVAKDAYDTKMAAMKAATDILNSAAKDALETRTYSIAEAQKIQDPAAKAAAIKAASDAYNNNSAVKKAKPAYMAAMKAASDAYNSNADVAKAKPAYNAAMKSANDTFQAEQKTCINGTIGFGGILRNLSASISNSLSGLFKFFSGK